MDILIIKKSRLVFLNINFSTNLISLNYLSNEFKILLDKQ